MRPDAAPSRARVLEHLPTLFALLVSLAAVWWLAIRDAPGGGAAETPDPQGTVWRMIDESRAGKVEGYLDCFTGDLRSRLEGAASDMSWERFSRYLQRGAEELKGVAVFDVEEEETHALLTVEYVYPAQSERQRLDLRLEDGVWRIARAEASRRQSSLIPHGTPIEEVD